MSLRRTGRIDLSDDPAFSRRSWTVERIGWIVLAAFLAAAFAGAIGPGLFSEVTARDEPGRLAATFDRFEHFHSDALVRVRVPREGAGVATVWIEDRYLEDVEIESVRPEPVAVRADTGGNTYTFATDRGDGSVEVRFQVNHRKAGLVRGRIGRSREQAVEIRQFVYP